MHAPGIQDYGAIGDGRSVALVSREGSIDWLCWPRIDSPSLFAAILDPERGGHWRIGPRGPARSRRAYLGDSNVLVTTFEVPGGGRVQLTDLMSVLDEEDKAHQLVPEHELLRLVDCEAGEVELEIRFRPRLDYGRGKVCLREARGLGLRLESGPRLLTLRGTLRGPLPFTLEEDGSALAIARLRAGDRLQFSLTDDGDGPAVLPPLGEFALESLRRSVRWWERWAARCTYDGPYRREVIRSLLTLKLLSYAPSGAIVAAPTTSLPERIGGPLNWDYRFCWLRDASLTVRVLTALGYPDEASAYVSWLLHSTRLTRPELEVLYDVHGGIPKREEVLGHLAGYRGSRPVRIRNDACAQLQLDCYGEVIDAVALMNRDGAPLDRATQQMLKQFGTYVCENWWRPDQGIWEPREEGSEHTHSRLVCWVALDRLIALQSRGALQGVDISRFGASRARIRRDIEDRGWNPRVASYTQVLGGDTVDASLLLMSTYGFAAAEHPRLRQTYERIHERLGVGPGLLQRYEESRADGEGAFGICCFWAADYLAQGGGTLEEAEAFLQQVLRYANDLGLFAEEIDPANGEPLGNYPQAFTHVGLIGAALSLEERRRRG